tara:strand:+ start:136 stop:765 length:630 start_codon:yes stop_codon:yes gene_type:complete
LKRRLPSTSINLSRGKDPKVRARGITWGFKKVIKIPTNMARAIRLEKYQGNPNGPFETIWIVTSENGNYFKTKDLQWKVDEKSNRAIPDLKSTKLTQLSNENHLKITDQYLCKEILEKGKHLKRSANGSFYDTSKPLTKSINKSMNKQKEWKFEFKEDGEKLSFTLSALSKEDAIQEFREMTESDHLITDLKITEIKSKSKDKGMSMGM